MREIADARDFLAATAGWRDGDPVGANLMASVAQQVVGGRTYERQWWFVAESADAVVGAAMWTPPHAVAVATMPTPAAHGLADAIAALAVPVPGVVGPVAAATEFARRFTPDALVERRERILVLDTYVPPPPVPGAARRASRDDVDLMTGWLRDFATETGMPFVGTPDAVLAVLPRTWLWEDHGVPVALAGHAPIVATSGHRTARIGPVFTPASQRGRRYASALTAAVVEHLRESADVVMLFTDASNPTSNAVYERLGFSHTDDLVELGLRRPSGA